MPFKCVHCLSIFMLYVLLLYYQAARLLNGFVVSLQQSACENLDFHVAQYLLSTQQGNYDATLQLSAARETGFVY